VTRSRLGAAAATGAVLAAVAVGCGGSSKSSAPATPEEWANDVCGAVKTWDDSLKSVGQQFQNPQNLSKDSLQSAATQVEDATQTLSDDLKSIGKPPTPNADEAKSTIDDLSTESSNSVDNIKSSTKNLSSVSDVANAVSATTGEVAKISASLNSAFKTLNSLDAKGTYKKAFQQASSCKGLTSSS
jgi:uncharacterized phage infection (PIP) family protein YhgE